MTRNHIHVRSSIHRRRNLLSFDRPRDSQIQSGISTGLESTNKVGPWTGGKILVPVTFDRASEHAVDIAIDMAKAMGAQVLLVHVAERGYGEGFLRSDRRESTQSLSVQSTSDRLATLAASRCESKVPIRWTVKTGHPSLEILRLAERENTKAIIVGRKPRNLVSRMFGGSVSSDIIECSSRPVFVVNSFAGSAAN